MLLAFSGVLGGHCFFFPPKKIPGGLQAAYGKYRGLVADILQSGIALGEFQKDITVEDLEMVIVATWDATGIHFWVDKKVDTKKVVRSRLDALLEGITVTR